MTSNEQAIQDLVCEACWNALFSFDGWRAVLDSAQAQDGKSRGFSYTTNWHTVKAAADNCGWCRLLPRRKRDVDAEVTVSTHKNSDCTPAGEKKLTIIVREDNHQILETDFYMFTSQDDNAAKFIKARNRITDVSTPSSHKLALDCLNHCVSNHHQGCPSPQPDTVLPDRVIDCSSVSNPKLIETGGKQHGFYVTLSYVWGGPQPMTTSDNREEYTTKGLIMSNFPQTIQDAVQVTYNLGQRYLWIDALCIIQDSEQDKAQQLGKMHSIYRNSYFTINVACAQSTHEGFLHKARPQRVTTTRIPLPCPDGTMGSIWLAKPMDTDINDGSHTYWDEIEPITYRAWCFQEKALPPRSLVFASDTLKYYCQTETVSIGGALCEPSTGPRLPKSAYMDLATLSESEQGAYRQAWLGIIFVYTLRSISVPSDKLPALAAVAEQFHLMSNDQYLAGLWRKTLLADLLWSVKEREPRPTEYRAPSWSWASVDGLVGAESRVDSLANPESEDDIRHLRTATIIACDVDIWSDQTPFGRVTGGVLTLDGWMREVKIGEPTYHLTIETNGTATTIGSVSFDAEEDRQGPLYVIPLIWDTRGLFVLGIVVVLADSTSRSYKRVGRFGNAYERKDVSWVAELERQRILLV